MTLNFGPYACTSQMLVLQMCVYAALGIESRASCMLGIESRASSMLGIESRASRTLGNPSTNICNAYFVRQVSYCPGCVHTWYYVHVELREQPCGAGSLLPTLHGI